MVSRRIITLSQTSNYKITRQHHHRYCRTCSCLPFIYLVLTGISFSTLFLLSWFTIFTADGESASLLVIKNNGNDDEENSRQLFLLMLSKNSKNGNATSLVQPLLPNDTFLADLFEQRKNNVESICRERYLKTQRITHPQILMNLNKNEKFSSNLYVSHPLKIVFCSIPKVASSNWFSYFDKLSRNSTFTGGLNYPGYDDVNKTVLKSFARYSTKEARAILKNYKKIMWVREPLQRLVSAWRDKLSVYNPFYSHTVGSVIIKRYRINATDDEITTGYPTSPEEFFKYLKYEQRLHYDIHWKPYYFSCSPCNLPLMKYDYIGHLENVGVEADYILRQLTRRNDYPSFPGAYQNRTSPTMLQEFISKVPRKLLEEVLRNFQIDYELFDYKLPKF